MPINCRECRSADAEIFIPYARLSLCPECFQGFFVRRLRRTVKEFRMFKEDGKVGVAVSGGKDSAALCHGLRQAFPDLQLVALHVNLGISDYSKHCQLKTEKLTKTLSIDLYVFDLEEELGINIEDFERTIFRKKICSPCGTIKRHIFEELARRAGVQVLATGHNLDDVTGLMIHNFFHGDWSQLARFKPVLQPLMPKLSFKVKPLIRSPEIENLLYCLYGEVPFREMECPLSRGSRVRKQVKILEALSRENPSFRHQTLRRFLKLIPLLEKTFGKPDLTPCKICGLPSVSGVCAFCKRVDLARKASGKT